MNNHIKLGVDYLVSIGYNESDIITNDVFKSHKIYRKNVGKPDLTTKSDGKEWEIKTVYHVSSGKTLLKRDNRIVFSESQIKMNDDVNILIFREGYSKPEKIVKFGDILSGKNVDYEYLVNFKINIVLAAEMLEQFKDKILNSRKELLIVDSRVSENSERFSEYIIRRYKKKGKKILNGYNKDELDVLISIKGFGGMDEEDKKYLTDEQKKELDGYKNKNI